jgi:hypothetical protein
MRLRTTSSAIGIGSMGALSHADFAPWASGTSLPRQPLLAGAGRHPHAGLRSRHEEAGVCVPKTLSELMTSRNRLSWRNDRAAVFRPRCLGRAIQVDDPA